MEVAMYPFSLKQSPEKLSESINEKDDLNLNYKCLIEQREKLESELEYLNKMKSLTDKKSQYHKNFLNGFTSSEIYQAIRNNKVILYYPIKYRNYEDYLGRKRSKA